MLRTRIYLTHIHKIIRNYSSSNQNDILLQKLSGNYDGINVISFNKQATRNALSKNIIEKCKEYVDSIQFDKNARVVILRSNVPGIFCAGADLKERATMNETEVTKFVSQLRKLFSQIEELPMPVIAAIDGAALGGGLEIALCADIRVASENAKLGLVETKLAIIPGAGGTQRLPRLIGPAAAKELIFTSKILNGKESKELGLVNHSVPQTSDGDAAYNKAIEIAQQIVPNGPIGIKMAKVAITKGLEVDLHTGLTIEGACYAQVIPTKDRIEALSAFKEKRKPNFIGE